jgi:hypothetical protein
MRITPDGTTVYAAGMASGGDWVITPITTATNTAGAPVTFQTTRYQTWVSQVRIGGITPDGKTLYAIYHLDGFDTSSGLESISTATDAPIDAFPLATEAPGQLVFTR